MMLSLRCGFRTTYRHVATVGNDAGTLNFGQAQGGALSTTLIHSGTLVCMDDAWRVLRGDLLIRDARIAALGDDVPTALAGREPDHRIDAAGALVLPGFVQGHLHLCQTLFRGLAEQADLLRWLRESIWPLEAAHEPASLAASARLGLLELIASGVTCINDMGTVRHTEVLGETIEASGIRALFGKALMDSGDGVPAALRDTSAAALDECHALVRRFHGAGAGRLSVTLAPRFILSCSDGLWEGAAALAASGGHILHTHLAESPAEGREVEQVVGATAARHFAARGVLSSRFVGAHGVWLDDDELRTLQHHDAALVHCPGSNLKLGSGIAHVRAWCDAGIRRGLGSDGAACNNRLDALHEMTLAGSVARVRDAARPLAPREVVALATCEGARALGLGDQIGSLAPGKAADLVVLDLGGVHLGPEPEADPYTTLVHAARATDVSLTMVDGRILYRDGRWSTLDPDAVQREARQERRGLLRRVEAHP
jgi:5-methylthioadenosine/S-adenosylhomocysteine deaminase